MQEKYCESCGMPMGESDDLYGTESDGSKSIDYCKYCYEKGSFTNPDITLQEMIGLVSEMMVKDFGFTPEEAKKQCDAGIPTLKRWKAA